jgi:hypothetical protein
MTTETIELDDADVMLLDKLQASLKLPSRSEVLKLALRFWSSIVEAAKKEDDGAAGKGGDPKNVVVVMRQPLTGGAGTAAVPVRDRPPLRGGKSTLEIVKVGDVELEPYEILHVADPYACAELADRVSRSVGFGEFRHVYANPSSLRFRRTKM